MASPEQLFARFLQHADARALAAVFDALAPELLLVAAHVAARGSEAEDLVQSTFLDAIEKAGRWDAARPLLPWLIGILVNHARLDRRERERRVDAARLPPQETSSPLDALASQEAVDLVAKSLQSLPQPLRHVLVLRLVRGLSPTEIAHALGCPVATVKTRLQRGMAWLRRVLPAGVASGVAGMLVTARGLAAVRQEVLGRVSSIGPAQAAVTVGGVVLAGVVMKKVVAWAVALAVFLVAFTMWIGPPSGSVGLRSDGREPPATVQSVLEPSLAPTAAGSTAGVRVSVAPRAPATTGRRLRRRCRRPPGRWRHRLRAGLPGQRGRASAARRDHG